MSEVPLYMDYSRQHTQSKDTHRILMCGPYNIKGRTTAVPVQGYLAHKKTPTPLGLA